MGLRFSVGGSCLSLFVLAGSAAGQTPLEDVGDGFPGVLISQQEVGLEPLIEGRLLEVYVRLGDKVGEGSVVAALDERPIRQELARAQAELDEVHAAQAEAGTRLSMAEETLRQRERLVDQGIVSADQVRDAEQEKKLAHAALDRARARVKQQEALISQLEDKLAHTRIVAPFAGTIAERYGEPGMMVGPGRPLVRMISGRGLWVRFAVPLNETRGLVVGGQVRVSVPELDLTTKGSIRQISPQVDPASGMIVCEAVVEPPARLDGPPLSGQAVRVRLSVE